MAKFRLFSRQPVRKTQTDRANHIPFKTPKNYQEIAKEISISHRFLPIRKERLKDTGFALTGRTLQKYQFARKADKSLPDLSVPTVQKRVMRQELISLEDSYQFIRNSLLGDQDPPEKPDGKGQSILRSTRIHLHPDQAQKLGFTYHRNQPREDALETQWDMLKPILAPVNFNAPDNPLTKVLEQYVRYTEQKPEEKTVEVTEDNLPVTTPEVALDLSARIDLLLERLSQGESGNEIYPADLSSQRQTSLYQSVGEEFEQQLECSAADATAYYDFYDLKLAFSPVWTEVTGKEALEPMPIILVDYDEKISIEVWNKYCQVMEEMGQSVTPVIKKAAKSLLHYIFWKTLEEKQEIYQSYNDVSLEHIIEISEVIKGRQKYDEILEFLEKLSNTQLPHLRAQREAELEHRIRDNFTKFQYYKMEVTNEIPAVSAQTADEATIYLGTPATLGYPARVFAPASVNYGLLVNYRQRWVPESWQVGDLVETIPLAPKEKRRYTKKTIITKKRSRKEIDNALSIRKADDALSTRAESQIVQRAQETTSFDATASGGVQVEVFGIGANANGSTTFKTSAASDSNETKRKMREAVAKSAREFHSEHRVEVQVDDSSTVEEFSENVLSNPNEEITVTFLFYELQRRYNVTEALHNVRSVILVANEVPHWSEIDWMWIKRHDWILKRCLLDDSFKPALDYVLEGQEAMGMKLDALKQRKDDLSAIVEGTKNAVKTLEAKESLSEADLKLFANTYYSTLGEDDGVVEDVFEFAFGGDEGTKEEEYEARMEGALDWLDRLGQKLKSKQEELTIQRNALDRAIDEFNKGLLEKHRKIRQVDRLIDHLRDNILYYMKAIWSHEPPDQRYLRLFDLEVPFIEYPADDTEVMVRVRSSANTIDDLLPGDAFEVILPPPDTSKIRFRKLVEIADLENMLGFKGNYMIFPLRLQSYTTAYMAQNFVGGLLEDSDSDQAQQRSWDINELLVNDKQPVAVGKSLQTFATDPDPNTTFLKHDVKDALSYLDLQQGYKIPEELKVKLNDLLQKGLLSPESAPQRIIVPTDSLYIEALPGKHPILEDFKLKHRLVDAQKAVAEYKKLELENIRAEARLRMLDLSDPDIDRHIRVDGDDVDVSIDG